MVLYTLWDGRKSFDQHLINCILWCMNTKARTKLSNVEPKILVDSFGRTLLHYAVACKNPDMVQYLIDRGCEIDARDNIGTTPLIYAMKVTHLPTIRILLSANADILAQNQLGCNPLQMAVAHRGYLQVDIITEIFDAVKRKCSGDCLMMARLLIDANCPLPQAMIFADVKLTKHMLNNGCTVADRDFDNFTALHHAVHRGDLNNVKLLVDRGADVNARTCRLQSPLHLYNFRSKSRVKLKIFKFLLDRGASLMDCDDEDYSVTTRLLRYGNVTDVKTLLEYDVDMFATNSKGCTLLHQAARNKNIGVIQLLEDKCFDANARDNNGDTALLCAAEFANWAAFEFLLQHGADLSIKDNHGHTTLYKCFSEWCHIENEMTNCLICAGLLLQYRMNCKFVQQNLEMVLDLLLQKRNFQLAEPVLAYLAVKNSADKNILDKLNFHKNLRQYFNACVQKIEEMKQTVVNDKVTLFKFLEEKEEQLVLYARKQTTVAILQEIVIKERHSDLYVVKVLRRRISKAVKAATLRNRSSIGLSEIRGFNCNFDVIDKIISFLDNESLRSVSRIGRK